MRDLEIQAAIEAAAGMLGLGEDYDEYGSSPPTPEAVAAAQEFARSFCGALVSKGLLYQMAVPVFGPGPGTSVDVHFRNDAADLLVCVASDGRTFSFFGVDFRELQVKGEHPLPELLNVVVPFYNNALFLHMLRPGRGK